MAVRSRDAYRTMCRTYGTTGKTQSKRFLSPDGKGGTVMPLMRVDMVKGRSKEEIRKILDIAY